MGPSPLPSHDPSLRATGVDSYLDYSRRLQRRAWLFAAIPLCIFVALITYGTARLERLQLEIAGAQNRLSITDEAIKNDSLKLRALQARLKNATDTAQIYGLAFNEVSDSPEKAQAVFKAAASKFPEVALITIQVADKSQLSQANIIAEDLRKAGYIVPPDEAIEVRGAHISRGTYLRYFFKNDRNLAQQVLNQINLTGAHAKLYDLSDARDLGEIHPRQFEFRLGLDSVQPADAGR
jgi:hypothetical protein